MVASKATRSAPRFPDLPAHMRHLKTDTRGYPVPWFVAWRDGAPIFQAMDGDKLARAVRDGLCWICGGKLGRFRASVIGPMCAITRISAEPQSHPDCATFAARNCPFLTNPQARRLPEKHWPGGTREPMAGVAIERNPGVALVWIERTPTILVKLNKGNLFQLGDPEHVEWYAHGRVATAYEVKASIISGLPLLRAECGKEPPGPRRLAALQELARNTFEVFEMIDQALK
jgi:hypothetical protein